MSNPVSLWKKWLHRRILSFLGTSEGCVLSVIGVVITVNTLLYVLLGPCAFTGMLDLIGIPKWEKFPTRRMCDQVGWKDNIGGVDTSYRTSYGSIDVVYTWVNGSDPKWKLKKAYWKAVDSGFPPPIGSSPDGSENLIVKHPLNKQRRLSLQRKLMYDEGYDEYFDTYGRSSHDEYSGKYGYRGSDYYSEYWAGERNIDDYSYEGHVMDDGFGAHYATEFGENVEDVINYIVDENNTLHNRTLAINQTINETITNSTVEESKNQMSDDSDADNRYRDSNELKYSLRSLEKYAPWVRHIYLVTDNQIPDWLKLDNPRISIVPHTSLFPNKSHLPVFSSPAIEAHLHRIPGLSQRFAYFNDDVFLGAPTWPEDFIGLDGSQKVYLSWDVPKCNDGCPDSWLGDGHCDKKCNVSKCGFDYPDCVNKTEGDNMGERRKKNGKTTTTKSAKKKEKVTTCVKGCPDNWLGDRVCDGRCDVSQCAYDGGDCGLDRVFRDFQGAQLTPKPSGNKTDAFWASTVESLQDFNPSYTAVVLPLNDSEPQAQLEPLLSIAYGTQVAYINLTEAFPFTGEANSSWNFQTATIEDPWRLVQNTVLIQKHSVLLLVMHHKGLENPMPLLPNVLPASVVVTVSAVQEEEGIAFNSKASRFRLEVTDEVLAVKTNTSSAPEINVGPELEVDGYATQCVVSNMNVTTGAVRKLSLRSMVTHNGVYELLIRFGATWTANFSGQHILVRQRVGSAGDSTLHWDSSLPVLVNHSIGIGSEHKPALVDVEATGFRVQIPPNLYRQSRNQTLEPSSWISAQVEVIAVDPSKADKRSCSGLKLAVWEHSACLVSRLKCAEAIFRFIPRARRRLSRRFSKRLRDIRISRETDGFRPKQIHLRGEGISGASAIVKPAVPFIQPDMTNGWLWSRVGWWMRLAENNRNQMQNPDPRKRRLLDTFGDSLIFVNQLFNKRFGVESGMRKVPAHMPHFIDRKVLAELQEAYPQEFDATSQHRFRSSTDMQYSFAYFYWLQNTKNNQDIAWNSLWRNELDVDHNGYLDDNELLTLTAMAKGKEPVLSDVEEMRDCLTTAAERIRYHNLSYSVDHVNSENESNLIAKLRSLVTGMLQHQPRLPAADPDVHLLPTMETLLECPLAVDGLRKNARKAPKFEKITQLTEVAFEMIGDDFNRTRDQLNSIRARKTKFVCVNDDMQQPTPEMVAFLQDFYLSFFPFPSQFENPPGVLNSILYYDEWRAAQHLWRLTYFLIGAAALMVVCLFSLNQSPRDLSREQQTVDDVSTRRTEVGMVSRKNKKMTNNRKLKR